MRFYRIDNTGSACYKNGVNRRDWLALGTVAIPAASAQARSSAAPPRVPMIDPVIGPNTDGSDPTACRNLFMSDCFIDTGGDALCLKSENAYGGPVWVAKNVTITNCVLTCCCNCLNRGVVARRRTAAHHHGKRFGRRPRTRAHLRRSPAVCRVRSENLGGTNLCDSVSQPHYLAWSLPA